MSSVDYVDNSKVTRIQFDEVSKILDSLKEQKDRINKVYTSKISKVLESSAECFQVSGLNPGDINDSFSKTFSDLDKRYYNLIDVLENSVLKGYTEAVVAIQQMFDSQFASQMAELLGVNTSVKTGSTT